MSRLPLLLLVVLPFAASAASPGKACDDARTQLDINECAAAEATAARAMNRQPKRNWRLTSHAPRRSILI